MDLLEVTDITGSLVPCFKGPSVYFLFLRGEIVYVGSSINHVSRIGNHSSGTCHIEFDAYSVIRVPDDTSPLFLERLYTKKFRPKYNDKVELNLNIDDQGMTALDRAMVRMDHGQSVEEAAKAEKLPPGAVRVRRSTEKRTHEKNQFLLPSINVRPTQKRFGKDWDANLGVHTPSRRSRAKQD